MAFIKKWNFWCQDCCFKASDVLSWIEAANIPKNLVFTPLYNQPTTVWTENDPTYGTYPIPDQPGNIIIISSTAVHGFGGMSHGMGYGCLVLAFEADMPSDLGARIWHEMLHVMGINVDKLMSPAPNDNDEFYTYITNNASKYAYALEGVIYMYAHPQESIPTYILLIYYTMLWEKYGYDKL